jgi:hypothetical protein
MPDVIRGLGDVDRDGHFRLAVGKRALQRNLLHRESVRLCAWVKERCSRIGHSRRIVVLHIAIRNRNCGVGFISKGEAAVTPAGVASADGVAESRCGAGVEGERDPSDPSSDGIWVGLV